MSNEVFPYDVFLSHSARDKARSAQTGRSWNPVRGARNLRFLDPLNKERRFSLLRFDKVDIKGPFAYGGRRNGAF